MKRKKIWRFLGVGMMLCTVLGCDDKSGAGGDAGDEFNADTHINYSTDSIPVNTDLSNDTGFESQSSDSNPDTGVDTIVKDTDTEIVIDGTEVEPMDSETSTDIGDSGSEKATDSETVDTSGNELTIVELANGHRQVNHVLNLVGDDVYQSLDEFLNHSDYEPAAPTDETYSQAISATAREFYRYYKDEYDFLMFAAIEDLNPKIGGLHQRAYSKDMPSIGIQRNTPWEWLGSNGRLKSLIGLDFTSFDERPPIAHEVLHHFGVRFDKSIGFGDKFEGGASGHWGTVSVNGQLGGFDGGSLLCKTPEGASPPGCTAEANGRVHYVVDLFSPVASPDQNRLYAPIELYLMGLVSADEIPQRYTVLLDAAPEPVEHNWLTEQVTVEASGIGEITVDDIIAVHGERPLATEAERIFVGALVVVSPEPASDEMMRAASLWAETFGGHIENGPWPSFETLTGGRAKMTMRLGERRDPNDGYDPDEQPVCDILAQNCQPGLGCYDVNDPYCSMAGAGEMGDVCYYTDDCGPGLGCPPGNLCAPYCDLNDETSSKSCDTLCPGAYGLLVDDATGEAAVGLCLAGAGEGACDPLAQDCDNGFGCYGISQTACQIAGEKSEGEVCDPVLSEPACQPGYMCVGIEGESTSYCAAYCDMNSSSENDCDIVCPDGAWEFDGYSICIP